MRMNQNNGAEARGEFHQVHDPHLQSRHGLSPFGIQHRSTDDRTRNVGATHKVTRGIGTKNLGNSTKPTIQISHQTGGDNRELPAQDTHHRSTDHRLNKLAANCHSAQDISTEHKEKSQEIHQVHNPHLSQQNDRSEPGTGRPTGSQNRSPAQPGTETWEPITRLARVSAQNIG